ncbi:MAG TPA: hypothetical protein VMM93_03150 [Vicinamibacterales bacterium]|nr:hypothetical protein [Vicinamibacterales bacterium]
MFRRQDRALVRIALVAGAVALAVTAIPAYQAQPLPTGRAVVDRFVEAIGGEAAFRGISSMRATGTFEMAAQGVTGTIEVISSRPSSVRVKADITGVGLIERGYDGKVGWSMDPLAGPAILTGRQLQELLDDARFDSQLHPAEMFKELTTVEQTTFDGQPAYKVKAVFTSGTEQFEYFAVDSGLLIGSEGSREMPGGGVVPRVSIMRDYKAFGPLKQPTRLVQQTLGLEQVLTITGYDYTAIPATAFAPPPEVQALIKGR